MNVRNSTVELEHTLLKNVHWHNGFLRNEKGKVILGEDDQAIKKPNLNYVEARNLLHDWYLDHDEPGFAYCASIGMFFSFIPEGEFIMGSPETEEGRYSDEKQKHVKIEEPFYMGIYAITQAQYQTVMGTNPSHFSATGGGKKDVEGMDTSDFPVEMVSWNDAQEFCKKLSELTGLEVTLPTEAEWEYACRAGTTTPFHYGDKLDSTMANFDGNHPYGGAKKGPYLKRTCRVGSYEPNAWGLYDMHGNVWEWCQDKYQEEGEEGNDSGDT